MALPVETEGQNGSGQPSIARINDCWLEGEHHAESDREFASRIALCAPQIPYLVRESRELLRRMTTHLLALGVRQFLDLGSGIPTQGHVHEIARKQAIEARVLYVDLDPSVAADGAGILEGEDNAAFLCADVRDPESILGSAEAHRLFDLNEPVAVLLVETLLYLSDSEDPAGVVRSYVDRLPSGSYVGIVHFSEDEELANGLGLFSRMFGTPPAVTLRGSHRVVEYLAGLELEEPGVVPVPLWKPEAEGLVKNPDRVPVHAGLGRKP